MANGNPMSLEFDTRLDTDEFIKGVDELQKALQSLKDTLVDVSTTLKNAFDLSSVQDGIREAAQTARDLERDMQEASDIQYGNSDGDETDFWEMQEGMQGATEAASEMNSALPALADALGSVAGAFGSVAGKMVEFHKNVSIQVFKTLGNSARDAAKSLGRMVSGKIIGSIKNLSNSFLHADRSSKQFTRGLKRGFSTVLRYALGIRGTFQLIRKLRSAILDGFNTIAENDPAFKQTIDDLKAAAEELKMSFAAAFLPIVQIALPYITKLINALSHAIAYIGMFVAAMTGQTTYKQAVKNQDAAADSANNAADAYGNAAAAAKEAKKTVASFDELHNMNDNSANASANAGAKAGGYSLVDMPVESKIDDLAKKLKEMWDMADFTALGKKLGESLKAILDSIPWDYIKEIARKLGKSLATLINGFLEVPGLFTTIGKTIAEAINTLFEFLNAFVHNLHWASLGTAIKDLILGILDNLDWPLILDTFATFGAGLGQAIESAFNNPEIWTGIFTTISHAIEALLLFIYNLVSVPDWAGIGKNIGIGLNKGVEEFPWELLSKTISEVLNSLFDFVYNLMTTFNFRGLGEHVGKSITDALAGTDWAKGGAAIAATINGLFDFLNGLMEETDFALLGKSVIDAIGGFLSTLDLSKWSEFLSNFWIGCWDFLSGAIQEVDWAALPGEIFNKIKEFLSGFKWEEIAESATTLLGSVFGAVMTFGYNALALMGENAYAAIYDMIDGGWQGVIDWFAGVASWIDQHMLQPFVTAFKKVFNVDTAGIDTLGSDIMGGIGKGIISWISGIGTWITEHIFNPIVNGIKNAFDINSPSKVMEPFGWDIIAGIGEGIISWITGIPAWLAEHVGGPIIGGIKKLFGIGEGDPALKESGEDTIEGMKNGMAGALSNAFGWVKTNVGDKLLGPIRSVFGTENGSSTVTEGYGEQIAGGLQDGIKSKAGGMEKVTKDKLVSPVIDPLKSGFGLSGNEAKKFSEIGTQITGSMQSGIGKGAGKIKDTMASLAKAVVSIFKDTKWEDVGTGIIEPIAKAVQDGAKKVIDVFRGLADGIVTFFKTVNWGELGSFLIGSIEESINEGARQVLDTVSGLCNGIVDFFKSVDWDGIGLGIIADIAGAISNGVSTAVDAAKSTANGIIETFQNSDWASAGSNVISSIYSTISNGAGTLVDLAGSMANNMFGAFGNFNWTDIGANIVNGIWDGIQNGWSGLYNLVWDMAEDMWNAAKRALGIASPSKEFAWIGSMITKGLAGGIDDTQKSAVQSAAELAQAVVDGASGVKPVVTMDPAVDGLDNVLSSFSDRVVNSFASMIERMESIASGSSFYIPSPAAGTVLPYSARSGMAEGQDDTVRQIYNLLNQMNMGKMTRSDIQDILVRVFREYMNISFYLSDEQVARHANAGNELISRRYKPVAST